MKIVTKWKLKRFFKHKKNKTKESKRPLNEESIGMKEHNNHPISIKIETKQKKMSACDLFANKCSNFKVVLETSPQTR